MYSNVNCHRLHTMYSIKTATMYETAALRSAVVSDHIKRREPNDGNNVGHRRCRWVRATGGETRQDVTATRHGVE